MAWGNGQLELRVQDSTDGRLRAPRRARAGFTVVEVVISAGILAVLMSLAGMAMVRSSSAYQATTQRTALEMRVRRALDRIVEELGTASADSITTALDPFIASDTITFQQVVGLAGGAATLGPVSTIRFEYAPGETPNGLDDNGNGLIDDGMLVLVRNDGAANEVSAVLCRNVPDLAEGETLNGMDDNGNGLIDEGGFSVNRVGDTLFVRLTSQQPDGQGGILESTVETSITLRN